jgi:hypothetical protein
MGDPCLAAFVTHANEAATDLKGHGFQPCHPIYFLEPGFSLHKGFYEKVVKVKADVAAVL